MVSCGAELCRFEQKTKRLAVRRPHREAVELLEEGDLLEAAPVEVDEAEVEVAALRVADVGAEDHLRAGGVEERREVGGAVVGEALDVRAVGVGDVDVEPVGADQALREERPVLVGLLRRAAGREARQTIFVPSGEKNAPPS